MRLIPKEEKFYDLFEELINKIEEGGKLFLDMVEDSKNWSMRRMSLPTEPMKRCTSHF
jgi:hypothetical protein